MAKRKEPFVFSSSHLARARAVVLVLFTLVVLASVNTHIRFLIFGFDYAFGLAGVYVFSALTISYGIFRLIHGTKRKVHKRYFLGTLFLFLGLFILLPDIGYGGTETAKGFETIHGDLLAAYWRLDGSLIYDLRFGGGVLGYLVSGFFVTSVGRFLPILLSVFFFVAAAITLAWPLLVRYVKHVKATRAMNKAEKVKQKQQEDAANLSAFGVPMPEENLAPEIPEPKPEPEPLIPTIASMPVRQTSMDFPPVERPTFAPASKTLMPSRRNLRLNAQAQEQKANIPPTPEARPLETPSLDRPFVASTPVRTSGFHKAYFGAVEPAKAEEVIIPVPENKPVKVFAPFEDEFKEAAPVVPEPAKPVETAPTTPIIVPMVAPTEEDDFAQSLVAEPVFTPAPAPYTQPAPAPFVRSEPEPEVAPIPVVTPAPKPAPTPAPAYVAPTPAPKEPEAPKEEEAEPLPPYTLPPVSLLQDMENQQNLQEMEEDCALKEAIINKAYADLKAGAHVIGHIIGPSVTQFSIQPDDNVSVATLGRFQKDLEMRLGGMPTRFAERVSGMNYCALEVANAVCRTISFKELFLGLPELNAKNSMLVPFGEDITGKVRYADLTELPHMLVAGTTGSGKSVFIHGLLFTLLMRNRPEELKLVLVDPKRVEMNKYRDLPHLLCPIIKEPSEAKVCLKKLCDEMDRRFKVFEHANCQSIRDYNDDYCEYSHKKKMPFIVVVIDEFADLVGAEKEVSDHVLRIGQKARAAGIHMIIATQRPDVKIITGTIKSNLPARVALTVASTVDSQTILGVKGAEELNGKGDMLIDCVQVAKKEFVRAQGAFVTSRDMRVIGDFIREQMPPKYDPDFLDLTEKEEEIPGSLGAASSGGGFDEGPSESTLGAIKAAGDEEKYQMIKAEVMKREFTSISQIQRDYSVGFPRAGKIYSRLLKEGIISLDSPNSSKGAKVVVHASEPETPSVPGASLDTETEWSGEYE